MDFTVEQEHRGVYNLWNNVCFEDVSIRNGFFIFLNVCTTYNLEQINLDSSCLVSGCEFELNIIIGDDIQRRFGLFLLLLVMIEEVSEK